MIKREEFHRWFNRDFWRGFSNKAFPIKIPKSKYARRVIVDSVYNSIKSAQYGPSIPEAELIINKGYGVARTIPVFCIKDYCVYYFCIKELEGVLCGNRTKNTFGGWTLGGKLRQQESDEIECENTDYGRYSFNPLAWTRVFGEFNSLLFSQLENKKYKYVLAFDLSNFYDCVRLDMLERWIREESNSDKGWIIALLFYLLNQWNRKRTGLHPQAVGLPQDALSDCSRILANFYLQRYDKFAEKVCLEAGAVYFRYADDQMILLKDTRKSEGLLLVLTRELDKYGLRVNQKKVNLWESEALKRHRCIKIQKIFSKQGDNKNPVLIKKFAKAYLAMSELKLKNSWNGGLPLLNRLLWAEIESLPKLLANKLITRMLSDKFLLCSDHKKMERLYVLTKKYKRHRALQKSIKELGKRKIHNSFHHEALTFSKTIKNFGMRQYFKIRIAALKKQIETHEVFK